MASLPGLSREIFGNVSAEARLLFYGLSCLVVAVLAQAVIRRVRLWLRGRPESGLPPWRTIGRNLWRLALLQRRNRGRTSAHAAHLLLFGGFCLLLLGTTLIGVEHWLAALWTPAGGGPVFHKGLYYAIYEPVLDFAGLAVLAGCAFFAHRRWRQPRTSPNAPGDWLVLGLLASISVTGYLLEGLRILREQTPLPWLSFVGAPLAHGFAAAGLTAAGAATAHQIAWWIHAVLALGLIGLFPYSRLLHAIAGTLRLAGGPVRLGNLRPVSIEEVEATGELGVTRIEQFSRGQLMALDACVACGRCDQACPAHEAGQPLSPREVVLGLRAEMDRTVLARSPGHPGEGTSDEGRDLAGEVVGSPALWACTTCSACAEVCPLAVNPVGFLLDLRRATVTASGLRGTPAQALQKTLRAGNPWGMSSGERMAWAAGLEVPTIEENPDCEVVYWVGCAAAYDRRIQKVARSLVRLMRAAGVNFAVLGNREQCTGESARRMGDELLFQELAGRNLESFRKHGIGAGGKRIVAHCPHCVNSLRQDYAQMGARLDVVHHTEFLDDLLTSGRLAVKGPDGGNAAAPLTYHDPCYLARVGGVVDEPRRLLRAARQGAPFTELPRKGRNTACCGAGGGRMWFDEAPERRAGRERLAEIEAAGADTLAVSCPFCLVMMTEGLAARDVTTNVRDVAEILDDQLQSDSTA